MPKTFKTTFPSTQCIIGCTKIFCQRPSSLSSQSAMCFNYKHHATFKGLLGIAPSEAITFISELYEEPLPVKKILKRSGILNQNLRDDNDSLMAVRSFKIQNELAPLNVELNIPSFLGGSAQLTEAEVKEGQTIVSERIHVKKAITRIKKFKALNRSPLTLYGSVNQIWTVSCILCNFLLPLIQKNSAI